MAVACGLDRKKESYHRQRHKALNLLNAVESVINPPEYLCKAQPSTIEGVMRCQKKESE